MQKSQEIETSRIRSRSKSFNIETPEERAAHFPLFSNVSDRRRRLSETTLVNVNRMNSYYSDTIIYSREKVAQFFGKNQVPFVSGEGSARKTSQMFGVEAFKVADRKNSQDEGFK